MKRYKFLRLINGKIKSQHGDLGWKIGEHKKHKGNISLCNSGFHCSKKIYQAFSYVQGEILAEVEAGGEVLSEEDKDVFSEMTINRAWKWQKKDSVALSIYAAELCIENFEKVYPNDKRPREAIDAAKKWLKDPTKENESAARSAARSAESAAESAESAAAWSAAWSAESAAARSAESAAESAAWSAAWSALVTKISEWMDNRLNELEPYEPTTRKLQNNRRIKRKNPRVRRKA